MLQTCTRAHLTISEQPGLAKASWTLSIWAESVEQLYLPHLALILLCPSAVTPLSSLSPRNTIFCTCVHLPLPHPQSGPGSHPQVLHLSCPSHPVTPAVFPTYLPPASSTTDLSSLPLSSRSFFYLLTCLILSLLLSYVIHF